MARQRKQRSSLPIVDDAEKFLDKMTDSVESWAQNGADLVRGGLSWLKKHKKLAVVILLGFLAYNYLLADRNEQDDEDEEDY